MWRRSFLLGMLCGTLLTAGLFALVQLFVPAGTAAGPRAAARTVPPVAVRVTQAPGGQPRVLPAPLPPGWHRYEFNGQTVYVMPLASSDASQASAH